MKAIRPPEDEPKKCLFCGHDKRAELRPSTLEPGMWVCHDLDACFQRLLERLPVQRLRDASGY